jgi:hypothetical protein
MMYTVTLPDGTHKEISEAQLVGQVLDELRRQVQLVIGYAVTTGNLKDFLKLNGIEP